MRWRHSWIALAVTLPWLIPPGPEPATPVARDQAQPRVRMAPVGLVRTESRTGVAGGESSAHDDPVFWSLAESEPEAIEIGAPLDPDAPVLWSKAESGIDAIEIGQPLDPDVPFLWSLEEAESEMEAIEIGEPLDPDAPLLWSLEELVPEAIEVGKPLDPEDPDAWLDEEPESGADHPQRHYGATDFNHGHYTQRSS